MLFFYRKMNASNYLAELWGITIAVVSLALLINPKRLEKFFTEMENEAIMFLGGTATLVIGIAMVLIHNVWVKDWRVIITLLGWLSILKGADILFLPKRMRKRWAKMEKPQWQLIFTLLLVSGMILTYLGFSK